MWKNTLFHPMLPLKFFSLPGFNAAVVSRTPMVLGSLIGMLGYALLLRMSETSLLSMMSSFVLLIPGGMELAVPVMSCFVKTPFTIVNCASDYHQSSCSCRRSWLPAA
jgi:uncharacterized membrane protein